MLPDSFAGTALEEWAARQCPLATRLPQDQDVWNALEFIANNLTMTFGVSDVASAFCMSRRTLECQFQKVVGCAMEKAISGIRAQAAVLLRTTDLSVTRVGAHVGINSAAQFSRQFKKESGKTPTEYSKPYRKRADYCGDAS